MKLEQLAHFQGQLIFLVELSPGIAVIFTKCIEQLIRTPGVHFNNINSLWSQ